VFETFELFACSPFSSRWAFAGAQESSRSLCSPQIASYSSLRAAVASLRSYTYVHPNLLLSGNPGISCQFLLLCNNNNMHQQESLIIQTEQHLCFTDKNRMPGSCPPDASLQQLRGCKPLQPHSLACGSLPPSLHALPSAFQLHLDYIAMSPCRGPLVAAPGPLLPLVVPTTFSNTSLQLLASHSATFRARHFACATRCATISYNWLSL
jgi:hypothetical protein